MGNYETKKGTDQSKRGSMVGGKKGSKRNSIKNQSMLVESKEQSFDKSPKNVGGTLFDRYTIQEIRESKQKDEVLELARKAVEEKNQFSQAMEKMKDKQLGYKKKIAQADDQIQVLNNKIEAAELKYENQKKLISMHEHEI